MSYLLDTNICIRYLNGHSPNIKQQLAIVDPQDVKICAIVKAELFYGAVKSERVAYNLARLTPFFNQFESLPFDDHAVELYGQIRVALERAGTPIGPNDLLIAAIALAHDMTLVSNNLREFGRVPGLQVVDWT